MSVSIACVASKPRTNYVLVDLENIQPKDLMKLHPEQFVVHVFIGSKQTNVPFELAEALQRLGSDSSYVRIAGQGKNALDFHIAYYLGLLHHHNPRGYFHILSKDKGFDPLVAHLRQQGILVTRIEAILEIPCIQAKKTATQAVPPKDSRVQIVLTRLTQMKASKPGRLKSLESTISSIFQKTLSKSEVDSIMSELQRKGYVREVDKRLTYKLPGGR